MQEIKGILLVDNGVGRWVDEFGRAKSPDPVVTLGVMADLVLDLRSPVIDQNDEDGALLPYPIAEFNGLGLFFAMDNDYDEETIPPLTTAMGITVTSVNGKTILRIPLPDTNVPALKEAVGVKPNISFLCELVGLNTSNRAALSIETTMGMKNRVYKPEEGGGETPDPSDPEWLATVTAIIQNKVQQVAEELQGDDGKSSHLYIAYASSSAGASFSLTPSPAGLLYRAEFVSENYFAAPTLDDFQAAGAVFYQYIFPGEKGAAAHLFVAYSSSSAGDDFSLAPSDSLRYRAEFVSTSVIDAPTLADFVANGAVFLEYRGRNGTDGAGFTHRGEWQISETYAKNDLVLWKGAWMLSLIDGNRTQPPAPPASNSAWRTIVSSGANGHDVIHAYGPSDDSETGEWHPELLPGDKFYRMSTNGGVSWSIPRALSLPSVEMKIQFTASPLPLAPVWNELEYDPTTDYATAASSAYFRYRMAGGTWEDGRLIISLAETAAAAEIAEAEARLRSMPLRVQFSSEGEEDSAWHGVILEGDRYVRFFNTTGTVRVVWNLSAYDVDIEALQVSATGAHWHDTYQDADIFMRLSKDGGATYMSPWQFKGRDGKSTFDLWAERNPGQTIDDFFASLWASAGSLPTNGAAPGKVLIYGSSGPVWGDLTAYTPVPPQVPPDEAATPKDLPEDTERRIWKFLRYARPDDQRELAFFWQTSADGTSWGTLFSTSTHPEIAKSEVDGEPAQFADAQGRAVLLPVYYIPMDNIHVRTCWGFRDDEGEWHKGDWSYRNTLGVTLSRYGDSIEAADRNNPEYFIVPIPDDVDHCEVHILGADGSIFGQPIYRSDRPGARNFYFTGEDVLAYDEATSANFPVPVTDAAFEGQYFIFHRRGLGYNVRVVWTGDKPAVYYWHP